MLITPPMLPRAIIFDLGKVIVEFDHMTLCNNIGRRSSTPAEAVFRGIFGSAIEKDFDSGGLSPEAFHEAVLRLLHSPLTMPELARLWSDIFSLHPGIDMLIEQLKPRFRLFCLSNTNPWHYTWCRDRFPVMRLFEGLILSYEERCCKPGLKIYERALARMGEEPHDCLFIDDMQENVLGARGAGMQAVQFTGLAGLRAYFREAGILDTG